MFIFGRVRLICITKRRPTIVNNSTMTNYSHRQLLVISILLNMHDNFSWNGLPIYSINKISLNRVFFFSSSRSLLFLSGYKYFYVFWLYVIHIYLCLGMCFVFGVCVCVYGVGWGSRGKGWMPNMWYIYIYI